MKLTKGKYSLFYRCAHYFFENRGPNDKVCTNYLTLRDQENLYAELELMEENDTLEQGATGRVNSVKYEIAEVSDRIVRVKVDNLKK